MPSNQHYDLSFNILSESAVNCRINLGDEQLTMFRTTNNGQFTYITLYGVFLTKGRQKLEIIPDPRAKYICPLLDEDAIAFVQAEFLSAVKTAFSALMQAPEISEMLPRYSEMLDEYKRFTEKEW